MIVVASSVYKDKQSVVYPALFFNYAADVGIKKQLPILQQQLKDHWESEKRKYQGMF